MQFFTVTRSHQLTAPKDLFCVHSHRRQAQAVLHGSLCEYTGHDSLKPYEMVLYGSPRAPLMTPWLGELEGTSLVIRNSLACSLARPRAVAITSTLTHVWGAYGAPTLCRRCAADGRRSLTITSLWAHHERFSRGFECWRPHSAPPTECGQRKKPSGKRSWWAQTTFFDMRT